MSTTLDREPRPGEQIGPYEIVGRIAQGGMGSIHAARRRAAFGFEKLCAVKLLHPQLLAERRFVDMFLDEARIAARIDHPNVVATLDVIEHGGAPVIVMELLRGRSLSALLGKGPLPPAALYTILAGAAEGLAAAHGTVDADGRSLEVVHRDVSPHNIHVGYEGHVKLIDFGVAAARGKISSTRTGEVKGKLAYLAPEQVMQGVIDHRTDLFALGVVAWEALTGERLFRQEEEGATLWAVMHKPIPPLGERVPSVPPDVARVVGACLSRSIEERPSSAREVASVFAQAARTEAPTSSPLSVVAEAMRRMAEERTRDDAELATLTRTLESTSDPALGATAATRPSAAESTSTLATGSVLPVPPATNTRPRWLMAGVAGIALAATALGLSWRRVEEPVAGATSSATATVSASTETITFGVSADVRLVLVDGARVDDRPLTIAMAPDGSARVSLIASDGRIEERVVTRVDAGRTLSLASPTPSASAPLPAASSNTAAPIARAGAKRSAATASAPPPRASTTPLLRSPY